MDRYNMQQINLRQLNKMKHAIGISRELIKRYTYTPYRNYYCAGTQEDNDWERLMLYGLAEKRNMWDKEYTTYKVSRKGLDILQDLMLIKIKNESK